MHLLAWLLQVMLGLPIVPSIGNLDFWLRLCNVRGLPESQQLLGMLRGSQRLRHHRADHVRALAAEAEVAALRSSSSSSSSNRCAQCSQTVLP